MDWNKIFQILACIQKLGELLKQIAEPHMQNGTELSF